MKYQYAGCEAEDSGKCPGDVPTDDRNHHTETQGSEYDEAEDEGMGEILQ